MRYVIFCYENIGIHKTKVLGDLFLFHDSEFCTSTSGIFSYFIWCWFNRFFVYLERSAGIFVCQVISSCSSLRYSANIFLTSLSSREWNVITAIFPPGARWCIAYSRESSIWVNSSFTAIRRAWKHRSGDFWSKLDSEIMLRSFAVVSIRRTFRFSTMARAM